MADKERTLTDRMREAVNSPTGKRIAEDVRDLSGGRVIQDVVERVQKRRQGRAKGKERRSSSR